MSRNKSSGKETIRSRSDSRIEFACYTNNRYTSNRRRERKKSIKIDLCWSIVLKLDRTMITIVHTNAHQRPKDGWRNVEMGRNERKPANNANRTKCIYSVHYNDHCGSFVRLLRYFFPSSRSLRSVKSNKNHFKCEKFFNAAAYFRCYYFLSNVYSSHLNAIPATRSLPAALSFSLSLAIFVHFI